MAKFSENVLQDMSILRLYTLQSFFPQFLFATYPPEVFVSISTFFQNDRVRLHAIIQNVKHCLYTPKNKSFYAVIYIKRRLLESPLNRLRPQILTNSTIHLQFHPKK